LVAELAAAKGAGSAPIMREVTKVGALDPSKVGTFDEEK